jgi:succinate dehydrogenase / fumarate reductase flavoprotein subunit
MPRNVTSGRRVSISFACALERRESRASHNRSDFPEMDPALQVNLVWSADGSIAHEEIPPVPAEIATLMEDVSQVGKLLE